MRKRFALGVLVLVVFAGVAVAEEVTGEILFKYTDISTRGFARGYALDTNDDFVEDMYVLLFDWDKSNSLSTSTTLRRYLQEGNQVVFENQGLKPFDKFESDRLLAIIINDRRVELTQMFARDVIAREFTYLDRKLRAQGQ